MWHLAFENSKRENNAEVASLKVENEKLQREVEKLAQGVGWLRKVSYAQGDVVGTVPGLQDTLNTLVTKPAGICCALKCSAEGAG